MRNPVSLAACFSLAALIVVLGGCSQGNDLRQWVAQEKAKKGAPLEPLPVIKTFETFEYKDQDLRDPFNVSADEQEQSANNGPHPDQDRPREPLEAFPLDGLRMAGHQFGKAIDPAWRHAVSGGRIDDARLAAPQAVDQRHGLARRIVVQAQHDQVHAGHQVSLGAGVLAQLGRDAHELDLGHERQALADLQAGGAGFAVNENLGHGTKPRENRGWAGETTY